MAFSETSQQSSTQQEGQVRVGNGTAFDDEELFGAEEERSSLRSIIRNLQIELAEKAQVIEEQQNTIQTLQSDVQGLKKTATKRRKRATAVPVNKSEQSLEAVAKRFTVMNHFYVADPERFLKTPLSEAWTEKRRFDSEQNQSEGLVRELDALLSDDLKAERILSAERWAVVFEQAQQDERHCMTHRIRTSSSTAIFGSEVATELEARHRSRSSLLQQKLGFDAEKGSYERVPPILRRNPDEPVSKSNMLNSQVVKKVIQAILMGPASLGKDQDPDISLTAKCSGKMWNITSVTPGIISFAAILIRYALSPDNEFGPTGQSSGIPYLEDFEYYKKCLIVGQRKKVSAVLELFNDFNSTLFPHHKGSLPDQRTNGSSSAEDDELFREIAEAESEEDSEDEDHLERTHTSLQVPRAGPASSDIADPLALHTDPGDDVAMSFSSGDNNKEIGEQAEEGHDTSKSGDRRRTLRGNDRPKRGAAAKRGGHKGGSSGKKGATKQK